MNKIPLRVMFDTNTYRRIIDCSADANNTEVVYRKINEMIKNNEIEAFLSETLFTIEAIKKVDRLGFIANQQPNISSKIHTGNNSAHIHFMLGPDNEHSVNFEGTGPLKDYFLKALNLGFKIIRLPRIGGILNREIDDDVLFKFDNPSDWSNYYGKACEVGEDIEKKGGGFAHIEELLRYYDDSSNSILHKFKLMFDCVNSLPINERKTKITKVAKAIAEMSDGDSVASSIGLNCMAFCTNDKAIGAGEKSIFSDDNIQYLRDTYGFNKLTPTELIEFIEKETK